jgi:hypothetical protein
MSIERYISQKIINSVANRNKVSFKFWLKKILILFFVIGIILAWLFYYIFQTN